MDKVAHPQGEPLSPNERPRHGHVFNDTPTYHLLRSRRRTRRRQRNRVACAILASGRNTP